MKLRDADDGHNVYVLYSDLLFNLLILFTIFVLALVLRLNASLRNVAAREQTLAQTDAVAERDQAVRERDQARLDLFALEGSTDSLRQQAARVAGLEQDLYAAREQLDQAHSGEAALRAQAATADATARERDQARADLAKAQQDNAALRAAAGDPDAKVRDMVDARLGAVAQQFAIAAGANRFTGRTGATCLCVAVDLSQGQPRYVFIDSSTFSSAHANLDGEDGDAHKRRAATLLRAATRGAERFTEAQLRGLFASIRTRPGGEEGSLFFSFSATATCAASGWLDEDGDVAVERASARVPRGPDFSEYNAGLIQNLIGLRDTLRAGTPPETLPVLSFRIDDADHRFVHLSSANYSQKQFREILHAFGDGGIVLQYEPNADEVCPDWVVRDILTPVGYTNPVPDAEQLHRLRSQIEHKPAA